MFETAKLVDAGIDYIRVTSDDEQASAKMRDYYWRIAKEDKQKGYEEQVGGCFGFVGTKIRHALWGVKKDWRLCQVTGAAAKRCLKMCVEGTQASRIDVQATYYVGEENVGQALRSIYNAVCSHPNGKSRPVKVKLIEERYKAQTVYIGSRASDYFVRCYDKFEESGKEEYRGCVRVELELKGRASKSAWKHMLETADGVGWLLTILKQYVSKHGLELPDMPLKEIPEVVFKKEPTNEESQLMWLKRSISGTVTKLSATRGWIQPFSMLFDEALTTWDKRRILRALTDIYGD
jgi:hypothetical protein